jgi:tripartite ATP-independent transporter DctP family solute receptor
MIFKALLKLSICFVFLLGIIFAGLGQALAAEYKLTLASIVPLESTMGLAAKEFKKNVEGRTRRAVSIELAFAGILGGDREIVEQCKLGMLDMVFSSDIGYSTVVKAVGFAAMPYLFETYEDADKLFFHGFIGEEFKKRLLKGGNIRLLSWGENDFRALTNNKRPIVEVKDLRGLKIRTPEFPMLISFFRNLGALPTPIPYPELFVALQQGTVDGQDNGVNATYYTRLYEVQKYYTFTNHLYSSVGIGVSEKKWAQLLPDLQKIIAQEAEKAGWYQIKLNHRQAQDFIKKMKDRGMQFSELSPEARVGFREAAVKVWNEFRPVYGEKLVDRIIAGRKK